MSLLLDIKQYERVRFPHLDIFEEPTKVWCSTNPFVREMNVLLGTIEAANRDVVT